MKTPAYFILIMLILCSTTTNAQFLKDLKKRVEERLVETVIEKTAEKVSQKASNSMDRAFDLDLKTNNQGKKISPQNLPGSFDFDYKYRLSITNGKGAMNLDYLLKSEANYLGIKADMDSEILMIMDRGQNINYMFMNTVDDKICTSTELIINNEPCNLSDYTVTELPNKTFLRYDCKGLRIENSDYVFTMYFTNETPISINDVFKTDSSRFPTIIQSQLQGSENALIMYMEMKDKKNKGKKSNSGIMECTLLEPISFTFNTSGYQFM
ncbi:MAG: hypothetical protein Q8Q51_09670 [Lutibacter sp.]|nr:hypothetical protein [Lutibacter sp.]